MIEERPSGRVAYGFTHELVRRALYDRLSRLRRAELHLRVGEALESRRRRSGTRARRPRPSLRRRGAARGLGSRGRVQPARRSGGAVALAFDEAAARLANRARAAASRTRSDGRSSCSSWVRQATAPGKASTRSRPSGRRRRSAACTTTPSCSHARRSATRTPAGARASSTRALWNCSRRRPRSSATATRSSASGCSAGSPAPSTSAASASAARSSAERCRPGAATGRTAPGSPGCSSFLLVTRGTSSLDEILAMLTEARELGEELGNTEIRAEAMAWRVPTFVALCDLDSARGRWRLLPKPRSRPRSRSCSMWPSTTARRSRLCDGRLEDAETQGSALARVEPAADRTRRRGDLRDPDVQRPPRAGAAGGARAGDRILAGELARRRALAPGPDRTARRSRYGAARRGASSTQVAADGLERCGNRCGSPHSPISPTPAQRSATSAIAALVYPELEPLSRGERDDRPLVSCYGAADRYWACSRRRSANGSAPRSISSAALELNRRMGAARGSRTPRTSTPLAAGQGPGATRRRRRRCSARPRELAERIGMPTLTPGSRTSAPGTAGRIPRRPLAAGGAGPAAGGSRPQQPGDREALVISEHTAANHIRSILRKTGCANRTEAASYAHERGLVAA